MGDGENEPMENSEKRKFASPVFRWYSVSIDTWKTGDPNFGGVGNLKFFHTIDINEMAAIFHFFHNGRCWYSISVNTRKTGDPNFGGVGNLKFFCSTTINEMVTILIFFIMADADINEMAAIF